MVECAEIIQDSTPRYLPTVNSEPRGAAYGYPYHRKPMTRSYNLLRSCSTSLSYLCCVLWNQETAKYRKSGPLFKILPGYDKMT
mmetsp:Transcript_32482/g.100511  ORF Transcript_32482/g.100511 Transcript_32482/m.100511 type:complete len:84 (+) Transcript_32482:709-960(+)